MSLSVAAVREEEGLEALSPELVLVDPDLAAWARRQLPGAGALWPERPRAPESILPSPTLSSGGSSEDAPLRSPDKERAPTAIVLTRVVAAAFSAAVLLFTDATIDGRGELTARSSESASVNHESESNENARTAPPLTEGVSTLLPQTRRFAWSPANGASSYHVQFFRGAEQIYSADTIHPYLTLPARWNIGGRSQSLEPGEYRWYVWPVFAGKRANRALVQAQLVIPSE